MSPPVEQLARQLGQQLLTRGLRLTCAESCTGGGIAQAVTAIAGSSGWFEFGFVTYANRAKQQLLGVSEQLLQQEGAVSEAVVRAMALGALRVAGADIAVAVSGIAGPDGGTPEKPVGTVWFAWAQGEQLSSRHCRFFGDRQSVRHQAVVTALRGLLEVTTGGSRSPRAVQTRITV